MRKKILKNQTNWKINKTVEKFKYVQKNELDNHMSRLGVEWVCEQHMVTINSNKKTRRDLKRH